MPQEPGTRDRSRGVERAARPALALLTVPRPGERLDGEPELPPEDGYVAFLHRGDEPDLEALHAAIAELDADDDADLLIGAVRVDGAGGGRVHLPPPDPVGVEQLLADGCLAPASLLASAAIPGLPQALEAFGSGAVAGTIALMIGGRPRTSDRVLATVAEDPAAGWWTDDDALAGLAELARSPLARERGVARPLRRELLSRALNERPILGQPWRLPDLAADDHDAEQLRELLDDLLWTIERQADSLLVLGGEWDEAPISPSPETGELFDLELVRRDDEITRLRVTEQELRERLGDLRRRLTEIRAARAADARLIADLRRAAAVGGRGRGRAAIRAVRRWLPARGGRDTEG